MKLMNEIESEFNAEIVEILVDNGTPVEFGQVLMVLSNLEFLEISIAVFIASTML